MASDFENKPARTGWLGIGALFAAIGASACCVGPLLLLSLGIGGVWMSTLTSMETVRPFFLIATLVFIGLAFRKLYLVENTCNADEACALYSVKRSQRILFWVGSTLLIGLLAFPWYAPFLFE